MIKLRNDDLFKHAEKSHRQWLVDTCNRYEKAGLWPSDAASAMTVIILEALADVWAAGNIDKPEDDEKLFDILKSMIRARVEIVQRKRQQEQDIKLC